MRMRGGGPYPTHPPIGTKKEREEDVVAAFRGLLILLPVGIAFWWFVVGPVLEWIARLFVAPVP